MIFSLIRKYLNPHPKPRLDFEWIGYCSNCDNKDHDNDMTLHVTRKGNIDHCYSCGLEKPLTGFKEQIIKDMRVSSWAHWQKYPLIPYNWYTLPEEQRWKILFPK